MVRIFLSGIGGSGKTTLVNDLLQEEYFQDFQTITEIARDIMKKKKITSEMISSNLKFHMMLQDEIVKEQTRQEKRLENSNYISDRCTMDCFAVIKMRMTKEDLDAFTERHKVAIERSVSLYRQSIFVVVHPWSAGEAEDDGVRIFMTPGEAEQFNTRLIEALRELEIPFIELRQPDRKRRVEIIQDLVLQAQTEPGQKR